VNAAAVTGGLAARRADPAWHLPVRPYSPIDALNRRAAATGSPLYASATRVANYNGHHVSLSWNDYRGYYIAEHYWGERVVHARGGFADCLRAVLHEYNRGALGASAEIRPRADDADACALLAQHPEIQPGGMWERDEGGGSRLRIGGWYTWRHTVAASCARDYAHPRALVRIFDWDLLQAAQSEAEYDAALKAKHGRVWQ
jgi:hypothetical protein